MYFEFDSKYASGLSTDRGDHLLAMLFLYAMQEKQDIKFDMPISERLYYQITTYLIDALHEENPNYAKINVIAELAVSDYVKESSENNVVGTGMSCGVDSFCNYYTHNYKNKCEEYKINILTFFNIGAFYYGDGKQVQKNDTFIYYDYKERSQRFADEVGLPLLVVDSNFAELFPQEHISVDAMRNCGVVLMFQKLFDIYYYSSTNSLNEFHLDPGGPSGYYEIYTLPCLTTNSVTFYSSNSSYSRLRKAITISNFDIAQRYLGICTTSGDKNCGKCAKCSRTLLMLDVADKVDAFSEVFDIPQYKKRRNMFCGYALASRKESDFIELVPALKNKKMFSMASYLYYILFVLVKPVEKLMRKLPSEKRRMLVKFAEKAHIRVPY